MMCDIIGRNLAHVWGGWMQENNTHLECQDRRRLFPVPFFIQSKTATSHPRRYLHVTDSNVSTPVTVKAMRGRP
jgi:hypothetical protein